MIRIDFFKKWRIFLFISLLAFVFSCSEDTPVFTNDWDEDVYFFGKDLKDKHVDLFFKMSENEFDNAIKQLRDSTSTFLEAEILIELSKIVSKIGDSHTQLLFSTLR